MRSRVAGAALALVLAGGPALAFDGEDVAPVALMRFSLPFGASGAERPAPHVDFGFAMPAADGSRQFFDAAPSLLDFRYDFAGEHRVTVGGVDIARRVTRLNQNGEDEQTWDAWDSNTWWILGGAAAVVGVAVAIETGSDDDGGGDPNDLPGLGNGTDNTPVVVTTPPTTP